MKRSDFYFHLPDELIARYPPERRGDSRLLVLNGVSGELCHDRFSHLADHLKPGDLLVFNDTRVIPARLYGRKSTGGRVEVLVERVLEARTALAHVRASKSPRAGSRLFFHADPDASGIAEIHDQSAGSGAHNNDWAEVTGRRGELFELAFGSDVRALLERIGHMPLPPYIDRADQLADRDRYQTVYACREGAVAAPTAGLHFTPELLQQLRDSGVDVAFVTLHVGAGTFQPVRADDVRNHRMHSEWLEVDAQACNQIDTCREQGGRVIAVGTTAVRCLETAAATGVLRPFIGETDIFIYPGYRFKIVDGLVTNFHLPESTLLMLVSAFAGREHVLGAYAAAVAERYRFFSYGDAMLVWPGSTSEARAAPDIERIR